MQELLGCKGLTEASDKILKGTLFTNCDYECFPGLRDVVEEMIILKELRNFSCINTDIKTTEFCQGIKGWREETSTSPSSRHLGHYKAALLDDELTK